MSRTITSNSITFMDFTDSRKLDAYITSNLPITQIYNQNTQTYIPDWNTTNLQLSAEIFLDSKEVTSNNYTTIVWYQRTDTQSKIKVGTGKSLTIKGNQLSGSVGIITYICEATYNDTSTNPPTAYAEISFARVDAGLNGSNGSDGTSVNILGSYNTIDELNSAHPTGNAGDAYIVDGDLYVWVVDDVKWENVGNIQGPAGKDGDNAKSIILSGDSQVFQVNKSNVITPATIKVVAYAFNTTITSWMYSTNGGQTFISSTPTGVLRSGNMIIINGANITSNSITIKVSDGEVFDVLTVYKATDGLDGDKGNDGAPAPIAFLTNENVTFSANAQGQIATTTITSNVVAYNGTTKVTPTVGTISGMPAGMTITPSTMLVSNEVMLTITIANNSTFGSTASNMGVISIPITSPVSTVLYLTWSKVNTGATGSTGAAGSDAYTVILTNESNTFVGDVSNAIEGSTTTQVLAYKGSDAQTVTISSVNGKAASTIDTDTGIDGLKFKCSALSDTSPTITFTCTTAFKSPSGLIPIVLSVGGIQFVKVFTYSIAFKGATGQNGSAGTPATAYWLVSSASAVQKTSAGTITVTPSTLTFTGKSQTGAATPIDYACRWVIEYSTDGTNYTNLHTSTANEASKSITVATTYKTIRARMYLAGGTSTLLDEQVIPIVSDGASASLVDITPSAYYFKSTTGKDGTFSPYSIFIYPRFQTVTYGKWEYSVNGVDWIDAVSNQSGITIGTFNSVPYTLRILSTSDLYTDTITSISFRCVSSNAAVYDTVSIAKIYDVVDLEIGGVNLIKNSNFAKTFSTYWVNMSTSYTIEQDSIYGKYLSFSSAVAGNSNNRIYTVGTNFSHEPNVTYTLSFYAKSPSNGAILQTNVAGGSYAFNHTLTTSWKKYTATYTTAISGSLTFWCQNANETVHIAKVKLEKGNKPTDWSLAPEDIDANIAEVNTRLINSLAEVKTTTDGISSKVSATEQSITTINDTISSLSTKVSAAEQKITSDAIVSTVRQSTDYIDDLSKKVGTTEIISKINQTAESVTISANKIGLLGATNIPDLTADKIKGGTLTLGGSNAATQNGQLVVKNASNADMVKLSKSGVVVKAGHLAVASDFTNQSYNFSTDTWTTTTNTSQLDLSDKYVRMGVYSPSGYSNSMKLTNSSLSFRGSSQGYGDWGSFIGHDEYYDFVIQDSVRGYMMFRGQGNTELAMIDGAGIVLNGLYSNTISSAANVHVNSSGRMYRSTASSRQYKTDIQDIQSEELNPARLYDLPVREFKFKEGYLSEDDACVDTLVPGFIAEEVAEIYPIACEYDGDKPENWNIRFIVPAMLKMIQDQKKEIDTLKEQIKNKVVN